MSARFVRLVGVGAFGMLLLFFAKPREAPAPTALRSPAPMSLRIKPDLVDPVEALEKARESLGADLELAAAAPASDEALRHGILLKLLEADTSAPLPGVRVVTSPAGKRPPQRVATSAQSVATDQDGVVLLDHFDGPGPYKVYALPYVPLAGASGVTSGKLAGTLSAAPIRGESDDAHGLSMGVLRVSMGLTVLMTSPLPAGVEASDVLFELRGSPSPRSSQIGGLTEFALGAAADNGWVRGRFRSLRNGVRNPGITIHAVTADGRYGLAVAREGHAHRDTVIEIDEPLEPRGVVQVELVALGAGEPFPTGERFLDAVRSVGFRRVEVGHGAFWLLESSSLFGRRVPRAPRAFEIHGLPLEPFEIGDVENFEYGLLGIDYWGSPQGSDSFKWRPAETQRVIPGHESPSPVTMVLRLERAK